MFLGKFSQRRPWYPSQQDITALLEVFESFSQIRQSGTGRCKIGCINLGKIAQADDFRSVPGAGDNRLDLMRGQILGLIDDDETALK